MQIVRSQKSEKTKVTEYVHKILILMRWRTVRVIENYSNQRCKGWSIS